MAKIGDQMRRDLALAGYAAGTQKHYWRAAWRLARRFMRPPTEITRDDLRVYVDELVASGVSPSCLKVHFAGIKFLFDKTLGRPSEVSFLSWPTQPRPLPRVLSVEQIAALLSALLVRSVRSFARVSRIWLTATCSASMSVHVCIDSVASSSRS